MKVFIVSDTELKIEISDTGGGESVSYQKKVSMKDNTDEVKYFPFSVIHSIAVCLFRSEEIRKAYGDQCIDLGHALFSEKLIPRQGPVRKALLNLMEKWARDCSNSKDCNMVPSSEFMSDNTGYKVLMEMKKRRAEAEKNVHKIQHLKERLKDAGVAVSESDDESSTG